MGGPGAGAWFLPEVDDEVLVAFEAGDLRRPYVLGGLWNGPDPAPEEPRKSGTGQPWSIITRGGSRILLEDGAGGSRISMETPAGRTLVLDDSEGGSVVVEVDAAMTRFKGVVMCDTLISGAVVSASYTPGAGNIW